MVVDLDETQEKELNITLNKVSGDWDLPKLADLLSELESTCSVRFTTRMSKKMTSMWMKP